MTNILPDLRRLTEAVHAAGADIAPTYREYVQLAFAIATDCGEAGRSDFLMLCSLSAKYDVHAANKLFSNALKTNNNSVHIGTAFHLAELCNVRPRPAEKPRQDAPAGTLGTPGAPYTAASHTHAHGYYNRAEMPAEEFPEAPAASLPAEAANAGTANSGTACSGTTYPGTTYPEAADEETCRGSEPLTPLPCFDNRTRQDQTAHLMALERGNGERHGQIGLTGTGRTQAKGDGMRANGIHIALLPKRLGTNGTTAV